jgi:hypothetical protein
VKKFLIFILIIALYSFKPAYNQQVYKLTVRQHLTITIPKVITAPAGEVVNLDTLYHIEGDISYDREWQFWNGALLQKVDNPIFTLTKDGVFYLTIIDENGCIAIDSIAMDIIMGIKNIYADKDNRHSIHVFPNPNTGTFYISISDCLPGYSVQIINSLGVQFLDKTLDCNNNEYSGTIMMPDKKSGIYYLLVKKGNEIIYRQKVIIVN